MATPTPLPPRGWYTDPGIPGRDRWWNGTNWTEFTHRSASPRRSMFGPTYARAFWAGPNRAAGRSLFVARLAVIASLLGIVLAVTASRAESTPLAVVVAVLVLAGVVLSLIGVVFGIAGVRRSSIQGAQVLAIWGLVLSSLWLLITGLEVGVMIAGLVGR